jgi:hypothetical protein
MAIVPEANWVETPFTNTMLSGFCNLLEQTMQGQHAEFVPTWYAPVDSSFTRVNLIPRRLVCAVHGDGFCGGGSGQGAAR